MTRPPRRRPRGFTLVEILVALVMLGVVGGALLELFQGSLRNVALSADYTRAALLARSMLAQLEARERFIAAEEQGRFDERFVWRLRAVKYFERDGNPPPKAAFEPVMVVLTVAWHDGDRERRYDVTSLFLSRAAEAAEATGATDEARPVEKSR